MSMLLVHEAFDRGRADVHAAAARLRHDHHEVDRRVSAFLAAGWTGVAADAFARAWQDWKAAAGQVLEGLDATADLLGAVQRDFREQDDASQAGLDAVSARIVDRLGR